MDKLTLVERLLKVEGSARPNNPLAVGTNWYRNPDGPEAAATIAALEAERGRLRSALGKIDRIACDASDRQKRIKSTLCHNDFAEIIQTVRSAARATLQGPSDV